jgi:SAM-dependent methyltransferase
MVRFRRKTMPLPNAPSHCFPEDAAPELRKIRPGHFWFEHRRRLILRELARALRSRPDPLVLEIGCGDGHVLEAIGARWRCVGIDERVSDLALMRGSGNRSSIAAAAASGLPFGAPFDAVGLFDVLEHAENDRELLRSAMEAIRPSGYLLATVPAGPSLWSAADRFAGHYRRYTRDQLQALFAGAGLEVVSLYPVFRILWPAARVKAWRGEDRPIPSVAREYSVPPALNRVLLRLLAIEDRVLGRSARGSGTSLMIVARKGAPPP